MVFLPALFAEVDSEHCKTTKAELFERIDNHLKLPTIFARHQSFWLGLEYASGLTKKEEQFLPLILSNCEKIFIPVMSQFICKLCTRMFILSIQTAANSLLYIDNLNKRFKEKYIFLLPLSPEITGFLMTLNHETSKYSCRFFSQYTLKKLFHIY